MIVGPAAPTIFDEQVFRFNHRLKNTDATRFSKLVSSIVGKRLTYAELTGKKNSKPQLRRRWGRGKRKQL